MSAELEKVRAESKKKEERVERIASESEKQSQGQTDKVGGAYCIEVDPLSYQKNKMYGR